jgi:hypothetical protein
LVFSSNLSLSICLCSLLSFIVVRHCPSAVATNGFGLGEGGV